MDYLLSMIHNCFYDKIFPCNSVANYFQENVFILLLFFNFPKDYFCIIVYFILYSRILLFKILFFIYLKCECKPLKLMCDFNTKIHKLRKFGVYRHFVLFYDLFNLKTEYIQRHFPRNTLIQLNI